MQEITIRVEGIDVQLKSALVCPEFIRGIQLGRDFFSQATRCTVNMIVGGSPHGGNFSAHMMMILASKGPQCMILRSVAEEGVGSVEVDQDHGDTPLIPDGLENMRFHSASGDTVIVPITHIPDGIASATLVVEQDLRIDVCEWCARPFPGLQVCGICRDFGTGAHVVYCSRACQKMAWPEHKQTDPHLADRAAKLSTKEKRGGQNSGGAVGGDDAGGGGGRKKTSKKGKGGRRT